FSLCFPVSRCQFVFVSPVSQEFQRFPMISTVLALTTLACVFDSVFAFSLPVPLPPQPSTWITTLDCVLDSAISGTFASSNYYPCDDPGLDKRRSPLPIPDWICLFIFGLYYRVPNPFSKACEYTPLSPSRAFESSGSTYVTLKCVCVCVCLCGEEMWFEGD